MVYPRGMNKVEKSTLATIKEFGFAYELKFYNGGYYANIPIIKETWCLNSRISEKDREQIKSYLSVQGQLELL